VVEGDADYEQGHFFVQAATFYHVHQQVIEVFALVVIEVLGVDELMNAFDFTFHVGVGLVKCATFWVLLFNKH
jgi:hypothetical protein